MLLCVPLGVFNIFLVPLMNNIALNYTDAAKASVLIYTMPAFTSVIYVIINKKINIKYIIVSMLSFTGVLVFVSLDKIGTGEIIILISAFFWAVGTFFSERININTGLISKVLYQNIVSLLLILITMPFVSANVYQSFSVLSKSDVLIPVLYMGVAGGVFVYILWFYMIENGGAVFTSYTILVSPVVSVLISWFFLDEIITLNMLIGMIFIICSVFISFNYKR
ncbi:DMT family transporter [Morganella psychrotolerans]|uniref:DMT family transporter n=1 Tax=Morganella psychrotolerans TaxID=368603 RepID=UPI001F2AFBC8|nr:DMT family transporter [Morganella psychrotolerans]